MTDYLKLYLAFLYCGLFTFGGGYSMLPVMERVIAVKRRWVTAQELAELFALGQIVPGVVAVNVSAFIGMKRKGFPGGVIAALGVITPSIVIVALVASFFGTFMDVPVVRNAMSGIFIAACSLILSAVYKLFRACVLPVKDDKSAESETQSPLQRAVLPLTLIAGAFTAIVVFGVSPVVTVAVTVAVSVVAGRRLPKK
jgi:chromate transporter